MNKRLMVEVSISELLDGVTASEVVKVYGVEEILSAISSHEIVKHSGIDSLLDWMDLAEIKDYIEYKEEKLKGNIA